MGKIAGKRAKIAGIIVTCGVTLMFGINYPAAGGGGMTGGATEFTQIANNAELATQVAQMSESLAHEIEQIMNQVKQITNQITMITDMIHNTAALPSKLIGQVTGAVSKIVGVYNRANGLLANLSNLDDEFYSKFYSAKNALKNSGAWIKNFSSEYYGLSVRMDEKTEKVLESLGVTGADITDSSKVLEKLSENAASAEGRNAILQAGNDLMGFMNGELIKVRALQA
ncbi:MAG: P-type conjugative transfer protein TrbJ, partial [Holosporaceae bacterium]|nr:P-type conjugative transfer protein TrbJ [Holosporaceae bacterium]